MQPETLVLDSRTLEAAWWSPDGARPPLVLLHEGLGSVGLWRGFPARLAQATGRAVMAWSRFGYGQSDPQAPPWPLDYMHREALETLPRVLDRAGIDRCVLIGHSDGASIAAIAAGIGERRRYRGLVLIAPHFFVEDITIASIAQAKQQYEAGGLREKLARHHRHPDVAFYGWNGAWLDPGFRTSFDLTDELAHIRVPILILQGKNDPYGTEAQARLAEQTCDCPVRTVLLDAAHAPHLEAPEVTLAAITGFVRHLFQVHENAD